MVTSATSFSRTGLTDFIVQRVTAVILLAYAACLGAFFYDNAALSHETLVGFFGHPGMQIFSTLAVLSTIAHAWIGLWTVGTDYLLPGHIGRSATAVRFVYQLVCILVLFVYFAWAMDMFWSL